MLLDYKAPFESIESLDLFMGQAGDEDEDDGKGEGNDKNRIRGKSGKQKLKVWIGIGIPYQDHQEPIRWVCPFLCSWAADHSIPAFGVDSSDAKAAAQRSIQIMIEGYRNRLGRRFFYRNGGECREEYGVPPPEKTPEQQQQDDKRFYEIHAFIQTTYWANKSKEETQQMITNLECRREELSR